MKRRMLMVCLLALLLLILGTPALAQEGPDQISATYTFGNIPLATLQNTILPGSLANDRGFTLGGIGSDMWHGPNDPSNEVFLVTDRGPNGQIAVDGANRRTFPVPDFTPLILHVQLESSGDITVLQALPIVGQSGKPVTGLSNLARDEKPYDYLAQTAFSLNPSGLDTEGLVRTANGDFWLVDEYSPSLLHLDATGKVIRRFVPQGIALDGADYPVAQVLPAIYGQRKINRGFEGLALSPNGRTFYLALQSPLSNPTKAIGDVSRQTRILAFDIASERPVAEYAYELEASATFDPSLPKPDEMKLSSIVALNATTLLVNERTDHVAKLYAVDITRATNILGSKWGDLATTPSLEALADPAAGGITALPKRLIIDLDSLPDMPDKIEGVNVIDRNTIVVANDNDFDINGGTFNTAGMYSGPGVRSKVLQIHLATPLPLATTTIPSALPRTGSEALDGTVLALLAGLMLGLGALLRRRRVSR